MDRFKLDRAAQWPEGPEENELEQIVYVAYNNDNASVEDVQKVLGQLWYAFVRRQHFMEGER